MALTESEKLKIARILSSGGTVIHYVDVNDKIYNLGSTYITAEVETDIRAELDRWDLAGAEFIKVHPNEKNFGAEINPENEKKDIRQNLATLLYFNDGQFSGGKRLMRG